MKHTNSLSEHVSLVYRVAPRAHHSTFGGLGIIEGFGNLPNGIWSRDLLQLVFIWSTISALLLGTYCFVSASSQNSGSADPIDDDFHFRAVHCAAANAGPVGGLMGQFWPGLSPIQAAASIPQPSQSKATEQQQSAIIKSATQQPKTGEDCSPSVKGESQRHSTTDRRIPWAAETDRLQRRTCSGINQNFDRQEWL